MDAVNQRDPAVVAAQITARLDRLPMTRHMWYLVTMIGVGAFFELYDMFFTGYIAPGLFKSGVLTATTVSFFGMTGLASFLAAQFTGLFIGAILFAGLSDRYGRRPIFMFALLWYSVATLILAFQDTANGLNFWRMVGGIGIGVEYTVGDTYISELSPKRSRGMAFCWKDSVSYWCSPIIALLAWMLVPIAPFGLDGWRWVVMLGSVGAISIWWMWLRLPESPRWLAQQGRFEEAERTIAAMEAKVAAQSGKPLPPPAPPIIADGRLGRYTEIFGPALRGRTVMLMVVNFFQTIGYYGFLAWIPTLLIAKGIRVTESLEYTFIIALFYPFAPLVFMPLADRIERKWQVTISSICVAVIGMVFSQLTVPVWLILCGCVQLIAINWLSYSVHSYESELFPTRVRGRAIGFVVSWGRFSNIFSGFVIAFCLRDFGVPGVFVFIAGAMAIMAASVSVFGPRTTQRSLEEIAP